MRNSKRKEVTESVKHQTPVSSAADPTLLGIQNREMAKQTINQIFKLINKYYNDGLTLTHNCRVGLRKMD